MLTAGFIKMAEPPLAIFLNAGGLSSPKYLEFKTTPKREDLGTPRNHSRCNKEYYYEVKNLTENGHNKFEASELRTW